MHICTSTCNISINNICAYFVCVCSGSCMFKICIKFHNALNLIKEEAL